MPDNKTTMLYIATGIIAVCFAYFFAVTFATISESGKRYVDIILGALIGSGFTALVTFYWGSSKSSDDKTDTINKQIQNAVDVAEDKKED